MTNDSPVRCVLCLQPVGMQDGDEHKRYWCGDLDGWAHYSCHPDANQTFGRNPEYSSATRESIATLDMATAAGHVVTKELEPYTNTEGVPSNMTRMVCTCGWRSRFFVVGQAARDARRDHLKHAAIYG